MPASPEATTRRATLADLVGYFLYLGAFGFGGPVALAGFMHRDLVERRRWVDEEEYRLGLALSQIMPGPLAAQLAIALGLAFVVPSFLMVVGISVAYRRYGGLWWMHVLASRAIYDLSTAAVALVSLAVLWRFKVPEPILVAAAGVVGLIVWPLVKGS
jgi:chromate transporter